ncbi:MAG: HAD hydrolase family protein [Burkholderiales bacterium]|nr:HAD hydrolase family protein [Burkholderiales bacterium]
MTTITYPSDALQLAKNIRVAFFDVDGVFTDGGLLFTEQGETIKRFSTLDGHGLKALQEAGITPAVITGRDSAALRKRLSDLGIHHAIFGTLDKAPAAQALLTQLGLVWSQASHMGDDWPDLAVMTRTALAFAPANAHHEVKARAHYVTQQQGGHGAVREVCDLLLTANGHYDRLLKDALQ